MASTETLFDEEFLRKLEYLKLVSSRLAPGHLKGEHRAKKRGSGIEFADYRPYVAGDDTKDMDWRAYLRLDKLLLRIFEEEADLPIYLLVDASRSMDFGRPSKFDYARRVAAALCYIGLLNLDRVSIVAYADGPSAEIASRRGRNQIWRAFRFLDRLGAAGETSLARTVRTFFAAGRRRGLVVVVSDFLDRDGVEAGLDLLRYFRHDVFLVQILSPEEEHPRLADEVRLVDAEDGGEERVEVTPALLAAYEKRLEEHCGRLAAYCHRHGWGYARASTELPFEDLVMDMLRRERPGPRR